MANSYALIQSAVYRHLAQVGPESSACLVRSRRLRSALPAAVTSPHRTWAARVLATLHELERQGRVTSAGTGMVGDPRVWAVAEGSSAPKHQAAAQRPGQRENASARQPEALATPEDPDEFLMHVEICGSPRHLVWYAALKAAQPLDRRGRSARTLIPDLERVPRAWLLQAATDGLCSFRERGGQPWLYPPKLPARIEALIEDIGGLRCVAPDPVGLVSRRVNTEPATVAEALAALEGSGRIRRTPDTDGAEMWVVSCGQSEDIGNVHVDISETEANGAVSDLAGLDPDTAGQ